MMLSALVFGSLSLAVLVGRLVRGHLPQEHISSDSKDAVKLAMGLVATMTALLLGLLVSSAKASYDSSRNQVIQMAAKVAMVDRMMAAYGPDAAPLRVNFHAVTQSAIDQMWPTAAGVSARLQPDGRAGEALFGEILSLQPTTDMQRALKGEMAELAVQLAGIRSLLTAQALPSISRPLMTVVVVWLVVIYLSFSLLAPPNATTAVALILSVASVAAAMLLILELDRPFGGLLQISSAPLVNAVTMFAP